jgi:hypothetical protein
MHQIWVKHILHKLSILQFWEIILLASKAYPYIYVGANIKYTDQPETRVNNLDMNRYELNIS